MIADNLITSAYYLSGVVARDLDVVSGPQLADGLELLNDILLEQSMTGRGIPYYGHTTFNFVVGQEKYLVSNLVETASVAFIRNNVRFSLIELPRDRYFGDGRFETLKTLPTTYSVERVVGGTNLYFYAKPDQANTVEVTGKFDLTEVNADTDLDPLLDRFYRSYLKYELANRISEFNDLVFPTGKMHTLFRLRRQMKLIGLPDSTIRVNRNNLINNTNYGVYVAMGGISP